MLTEQELLILYNDLNREGRERLSQYAYLVWTIDKYHRKYEKAHKGDKIITVKRL